MVRSRSGFNTNIGKNYYTSDSQLSPLLSPHSDSLSLPSLTFDYPFQSVDLRFISGFSKQVADRDPNFSYADTASRSLTPLEAPYNTVPDNGPFIATLPNYSSVFPAWASTTNFTEELRATSTNPDARLTWTAGLFYEVTQEHSLAVLTSNTGDLAAAALLGLPSSAGTPFAALNGIGFEVPQNLREDQEAAYAQGNLKLTDKLHLLAGVRITRDSFSFLEEQGGVLFGYPPGVVQVSGSGTVTQTPVTPLGGLQYFVNPNLNFYATAAKGFRPGGVNTAVSPTCAQSLAQIGYPNGAPVTYGADSLWSYELGSKAITWGGRASLDASLYYIDWPGVQTSLFLSCGSSFIFNAAKAVSKGGDLQAAFVLFPGLTARLGASYTDAYYASSVYSGLPLPVILAGARLPNIPMWSGTASLQYQFHVARLPAFVRLDYAYNGPSVQSSSGPGTAENQPGFTYRAPTGSATRARA